MISHILAIISMKVEHEKHHNISNMLHSRMGILADVGQF